MSPLTRQCIHCERMLAKYRPRSERSLMSMPLRLATNSLPSNFNCLSHLTLRELGYQRMSPITTLLGHDT